MSERLKGKIRTWKEGGFGFIEVEGGKHKDVFVHFSSVKNSILSEFEPGTEVEFEIAAGLKPGTLQAVNVYLVEPAPAAA